MNFLLKYKDKTFMVKKGGRLKDRISFYTVGLTMMIFDVEVVLTFAFLLSLTFATTSSFLSVGIFVVIR